MNFSSWTGFKLPAKPPKRLLPVQGAYVNYFTSPFVSVQEIANSRREPSQFIDPSARYMRVCWQRERDMSTNTPTSSPSTPVSASASDAYRLTAQEGETFLKIFSGSQEIRRHYDLFLWLKSELQEFLPHDILISACGDFASGHVKLDVVSALPGVRTAQLADCDIDDLAEELHSQWVAVGRRPLLLRPAELGTLLGQCACPVHSALRNMHSLLVHGVVNVRDGYDSVYLAFSRGSFAKGRCKKDYFVLLDLLMSQIETAFRRVAPFPLRAETAGAHGRNDWLDLSAREQEILDLICRGETNLQIAVALQISPFTVKNHLQRIFKKIGVSNRTQAATKYNQALHELRSVLTR